MKDHKEGEVEGAEEGMGGRRGEVCAAAATNNKRGTAASAADEEPGPVQTVRHGRGRADQVGHRLHCQTSGHHPRGHHRPCQQAYRCF